MIFNAASKAALVAARKSGGFTGTGGFKYAAPVLCGAELPRLWRDEDVAMADPRLLKISTCQRDPGHTNGFHSARTDAEIAEVNAAVDAAAAAHQARRYARSYPVLRGCAVTQGHADYCARYGHAVHTVDDVPMPNCPRCGASR